MLELYLSHFSRLEFDPSGKVLFFTWKPSSTDLDEKGVQQELGKIAEYAAGHRPDGLVLDAMHYPFHGNPDLNTWMSIDFFPGLGAKEIRFVGIVVPDELIDSLNEERLFPPDNLTWEYFPSMKDALEWIADQK